MRLRAKALILLLASAAMLTACQKGIPYIIDDDDDVPAKKEDDGIYKGLIPQEIDELPKLYIDTPGGVGVDKYHKDEWTTLCTIRISVKVKGEEKLVYEDDSLKIRGRGNTTWTHYPKKPYRFNLDHKANFIGTGQTKKWVLLSNWMDRTLLRNDVAFEAARRTSIEWVPSGTFVEFYLDGTHLGNYWLGEKINVEQGNFLADYLLEYDTGRSDPEDFTSSMGIWDKGKKSGGIPVHVKYPDLDDEANPTATVAAAQSALTTIEKGIYSENWPQYINVNSMIDWLLVNEVCMNAEPTHPKSCYFFIRKSKMHAGPAWDFDWGTFSSHYAKQLTQPINFNTIYYGFLTSQPAFKERIKQRWALLKPEFQSLDSYIDQKADWIRESEAVNSTLWPIFGMDMTGKVRNGNPLSEDSSGMINYDENMSFQEAVNSMKEALLARINYLDQIINAL